jgi:hypothetical protein
MIGSNTLIAVRIYVVDIRNVHLIPANDVDGTILCVDRRDRSRRCDTRRNRIGGHGVQKL